MANSQKRRPVVTVRYGEAQLKLVNIDLTVQSKSKYRSLHAMGDGTMGVKCFSNTCSSDTSSNGVSVTKLVVYEE